MMKLSLLTRVIAPALSIALSANAVANSDTSKRPLEVADIMQFKSISAPQLTENGHWVGYAAKPDRGDSTYHVKSSKTDVSYQVALGSSGTFSADGRYVAITVKPALLKKEQADKKEKKKLKNKLVVIELATGKQLEFEAVEGFALSDKFGYLAYAKKQQDEKKSDSENTASDKIKVATESGKEPKAEATSEVKLEEKAEDKPELHNKKRVKHDVYLVNLTDGSEQQIKNVDKYSFSPELAVFAYSTSTVDGVANQLQVIDLPSKETKTLVEKSASSFDRFSWGQKGAKLAFLQGDFTEEKDTRAQQVKIWSSKNNKVKTVKYDSANWFASAVGELTWSLDNKRLFFGLKPVVQDEVEVDTKVEVEADLFNTDKLVADRKLQIWHGDDPLIKTNEKWQLDQDKKHTYLAVYDERAKKAVELADLELRDVAFTNNPKATIGSTDLKYRKLRTWEGFFRDYYLVDLKSGKKSLVAEKLSRPNMKLSESGRYAAYYKDQQIWAFDRKSNKTFSLSDKLDIKLANEDHDYPSKVPGYGIAGWIEDDEGVLVYDKFDIWLLTLKQKNAKCLTCDVGRPNALRFRINDLDKDRDYFKEDETLLLTSYNEEYKNFGFYQLNLDTGALSKQREENKKFKFVSKAKEADTLLFTREDFSEFPDLWVSNFDTSTGKKITNVNPQKDQFLWGEPELVEWRSLHGVKHQGVLIKPANYQEGTQYPVVVYYYRRFSQRMYEFNQMKVNHRPNFPFYTSNGYAVFLPDVHFEVGTPGHSTNKSIIPGIQKIIDMGVADENAIGLHGHSWSGYQTLHSITQTDMFAAAVSGAPVSNMTSAYSGIRLGTGLARQFQYEQGQSRIGASMFERRDLYIENSPVFFADRITTPLLMQFGDIDDAVPWQQGVEMYLAMRRLDKNVILLQYEGEPHHLKKYPNKVDYTIKMKQYFDHYLKGMPAPTWMTKGEAYRETKSK